LNDCRTSGTVVARRPPNTIAEIGTPCGSSAWRDRLGLLPMLRTGAGTVKAATVLAIFAS
jgi:hypothetical protein